MKTRNYFFVSLFLMCLVPILLSAQDISVHKFIGKTKADVIKKYGNPVHQDNSNPDMMCMFYQSKSNRMIFVSDKEGIYQSESTTNFSSETGAKTAVEELIKNSLTDGFAVDSVSVNDFQIHKTGVKADVQMTENKITKNFDVSVKAHKSED
jgi:predicted RNA-binding protein